MSGRTVGQSARRRRRSRGLASGLVSLALLVTALVAVPTQASLAQVQPVISFGSATPISVTEGSDITVTLVATGSATGPRYASVQVELGTAEWGDVCSTYRGYAVFRRGVTSVDVTIPTCGDLDGDNETLTLRLGPLSRAAAGTPDSVSVTITESGPPTVSLSAPASVPEGGELVLTAQLSRPVRDQLTIPLVYTAGTAEPRDYISAWGIGISPGETTGTTRIRTRQDDDFDDDTFTVALGSLPAGVSAGSPSSVQVTIDDTDTSLASVTLTATDTVFEGQPVTVTVNLSGTLLTAVTVPLTVTLGTAESSDISAPSSITIPARSTSATTQITTVSDSDSDDETFTVALGVLSDQLGQGSPSSATVTITDGTPTVNLSVSPNPVTEGTTTTVTATLSATLPDRLVIPLVITRGSAELGDFGVAASITIDAGQRSGSTILAARQDEDSEIETLTVALGSLPAGVSAGSTASVLVTITDDDLHAAIRGAEPDGFIYVGEGSTKNVFVSLSTVPVPSVSLNVSVISGSLNLSVSSGSSLLFTPSARHKTVVLAGTQDSSQTYLDDAEVRFSFSSGDPRFTPFQVDKKVKVVDDDAPYTLYLRDHDKTVTYYETGEGLNIPVVVKASRRIPSTVNLSDSATEAQGFEFRRDRDDFLVRSGLIPAGSDTGAIIVNITDDSIVEAVDLGKVTFGAGVLDSTRNTLDIRLVDDDSSRVTVVPDGNGFGLVFSSKFYTDIDIWLLRWDGTSLSGRSQTLYQGATYLPFRNTSLASIACIVMMTPADRTSNVGTPPEKVAGTDGWHSDWLVVPDDGFAIIPSGASYQSATCADPPSFFTVP